MRVLQLLLVTSLALGGLQGLAQAEGPGILREAEGGGFHFVEIPFVSQTWQKNEWKHSITLLWPDSQRDFSKVILVSAESGDFFNDLKRQLSDGFQGRLIGGLLSSLKAPIALVNNLPPMPQPGFEAQTSDALIASTLSRFLSTGDAEIPVLVPMSRTILGAMDEIQSHLRSKSEKPVRFLLVGGSKTAWASWLAAALDQKKRVVGLVSAAFNVLNFKENLKHQKQLWGQLSEPLRMFEAVAKAAESIEDRPGSDEARRVRELFALVDPYSRLKNLRFPKLLVNGANDPYFPSDSEKFYWSSLQGSDNHRLYLPNFGHHGSGGLGDLMTLLTIIRSAKGFAELCFDPQRGRPPEFSSSVAKSSSGWSLILRAQAKPTSVSVWKMESSTADLRNRTWEPVVPMGDWRSGESRTPISAPQGENRFVGFFAEIEWTFEKGTFVETTPILIREKLGE